MRSGGLYEPDTCRLTRVKEIIAEKMAFVNIENAVQSRETSSVLQRSEQGREAAGVQEDDRLIAAQRVLFHQVEQAGERLTSVDGIQDDGFCSRETA